MNIAKYNHGNFIVQFLCHLKKTQSVKEVVKVQEVWSAV